MAHEVFKAIIDTYEREVFTLGELFDILRASGFSPAEAHIIVREAINRGHIGRVTFRKVHRNMPRKTSYVILSAHKGINKTLKQL